MGLMTPRAKQTTTVVGCVALIIASCVWIYFTQVRVEKYDVALHKRVGEVLAEQAAGVVGKKGRIVFIDISSKEWPELKTQIESFKNALKKLGDFELREIVLDTKDQPKYGVGTGMSGRRYVRTVKKNEKADVFVSFVGAPKLTDDELEELAKKPKLVAEARSPDNLPKLFEQNLLNAAVVSRFQFPAPGPVKAKTPDEIFNKRYQIVTASAPSPAIAPASE
jgi:hypothetical protein